MGDLYDLLLEQGYTEAEIEELMNLGVLGAEEGQLGDQVQRAQALQDAPGPRGRHTGRTYVAANPLEHIASGLNRFRGMQEERDSRQRLDEVAQEQARLRAMLLRGGAGRGPQMSPVAPQPLPPQLQGMGLK